MALAPVRRIAGRILAWPLRSLARLRPEGFIFLSLAVICGLWSLGANPWSNIPLLMCLILLSLWLLAAWQGTRSLRGLRLRRSHIERVFANDNLPVTLVLSNLSAWPAAGVVITEQVENEDTGRTGETPLLRTPRLAAAYGGAFVTVLPGKAHERVKYNLTVRRRGIYRFGDTAFETVFPLGFFHSAALRRLSTRLVVYPRLGELDTAFFRELEVSLEFLRRARPSRAEEDFRGLREYRQGDNPKWIHWRTSARLHRTLVKEFEEPQAKRVLVLIDTNLQRLAGQRFAAFEQALSFAGTVARDLARRGCEVECAGLQPPDRFLRTAVSRERRNLDALLEMLAGFKRDDRRTLAQLRDCLWRRGLHRAYVLVLGLGSLRAGVSLSWLMTGDNVLKVVDVRSEEFRRIFHRQETGALRDDLGDEDLLLGLGDEEVGEETPLEAAAAAAGGVPLLDQRR